MRWNKERANRATHAPARFPGLALPLAARRFLMCCLACRFAAGGLAAGERRSGQKAPC
jgi:hypothetical protein